MGKWATYKRRGSDFRGALTLVAPPAPTAVLSEGHVDTNQPGADNAGGSVTLLVWDVGLERWGSDETLPWDRNLRWEVSGYDPGTRLAWISDGNGVNYQGTSPHSNEILSP
jgi:hypothetical protein